MKNLKALLAIILAGLFWLTAGYAALAKALERSKDERSSKNKGRGCSPRRQICAVGLALPNVS